MRFDRKAEASVKKLSLYVEPPQAAIAKVRPLQRDPSCQLCSLHEGKKTVCLPGEGDPGGVLLIGEAPSKVDDSVGRPFVGGTGKFLRELVGRWWQGPVAYDNAVRCSGKDITEKQLNACRPYGAQVLREARPKRILCFGNAAIEGVLGHRPPVYSARRGYGFVFDELDDPIPVFFLPDPGYALRNTFIRRDFERDLKWALMCDAPVPSFEGVTYLVQTAADAEQAVKQLSQADIVTYDVETSGQMPNSDFTIEALTLKARGVGHAYTWTRTALAIAAATKPLLALLADPDVLKVTQNGKYDDRAVQTRYKSRVNGIHGDTRLWRKLLDPEAEAKLETLAYLVGLGGHKAEAQDKLDAICKELRRQAFPPSGLTPTGKQRKVKPPEFPVLERHLDQIRAGAEAMSFAFHYLDETTLYRYNARDVFSTDEVAVNLEQRMTQLPQTTAVWTKLTARANVAVREMEQWGIAVDRDAIVSFSAYCQMRMQEARQKIDLVEPGLNVNSPIQVRKLLFEKLKLKPVKETKSGAISTDESVLVALVDKHPVCAAIVKFRKYSKLDGTYAQGMLPHIREDGRIHPSILIDGTRTGRFSCAAPNCFSGDTEVLTPDGWVRLDQLGDQQVAQWHDGMLSWATPEAKIVGVSSELLYAVTNEHVDLRMTGDHRCLLQHRKTGEFRVFPAAEYPEDWRQLHAGFGGGDTELPPAWVVLLCATQADGSWHDGGIDFGFKKRRKYLRLIEALEALDADFSDYSKAGRPYRIRVKQGDVVRRLHAHLGEAKTFGWWVLKFGPATMARFCHEVMLWDGCATRMNHYASTQKINVDIVQAAFTMSGQRATIAEREYRPGKRIYQVNVTQRDYSLTTNVQRARVLSEDGKVYCVSVPTTYLLVRRNGRTAITGNCQNIPRSEAEGEDNADAAMARNCFIASPGYSLLELDFSQIELRVAADLAGDRAMIDDFKAGIDIHMNNATLSCSAAWGISRGQWEAMSKAERKPYRTKIKVATFAKLYGKTAGALAKEWGCARAEVDRILNAIWGRYKRLDRWTQEQIAFARKNGYVETWWDGAPAIRRPLPKIADSDELVRRHAENEAVNTPVQGTAAHYMSASIPMIVDYVRREKVDARVVLTVHDSVMLEVRTALVKPVANRCKTIMTNHPTKNGTPIAVEAKWGPAWGSMQELELA